VGRGIKLKTVYWALGVTQVFLRLFFSSFFVLLSVMAAFKQCFLALVLLVFSAGPTIAVIRAVKHRYPATHARIAHNRQTLCRP